MVATLACHGLASSFFWIGSLIPQLLTHLFVVKRLVQVEGFMGSGEDQGRKKLLVFVILILQSLPTPPPQLKKKKKGVKGLDGKY